MDVMPQQPPESRQSDHAPPSSDPDDSPPQTSSLPGSEPPPDPDPAAPADLPPVSLRTTLRRAAVGAVAAAVLVTGAVVSVPDDGKKVAPPPAPGPVMRALAATNAGAPASLADLTALIGDRRSWVGTHPSDARSWAVLGSAYVEWGRRSADVAYYGRAEQALRRSMDVQPGDRGNTAAWVGLAALANARHDFVTAKKWGETVRARQPKDWTAYPVLIDAYNGLGQYTAAGRAVERFTALRSGVPALSRTAQWYRNEGRREDALAIARDAANRATTPAEKTDCLFRLGELAWERGESEEAVVQYTAALRTDRAHPPSLAGRARALAALGRTDEAQRDYRAALSRRPSPAYMLELGELYESLGLDDDSRGQYTKLRRTLAQESGHGVDESLLLGRFEADHGDASRAVELLRAEWDRQHHSAVVADALGWALYRSGDSQSALTYAQQAANTGGGTALYAYHLGMIEQRLGNHSPARRHLEEALRTNPHFSPLDAPSAQEALDRLGPQEVPPAPEPTPPPNPPQQSQEPSEAPPAQQGAATAVPAGTTGTTDNPAPPESSAPGSR
ncbi:tetratricopeptide repeat protein [Streptomyces yanii]|uniref:Tetratricopeptide repeat protein n=1 Tax=Streptomyces yanii TaxID=78510 RepID=A0ABV5RB91_9ACTN